MITFDEAYKIVNEHFQKIQLRIIEIELEESLNYILAEDIVADINMPPFDNSSMDGYAIKYYSEINKWKIIGEISAGADSSIYSVDENTAVSIMTGAKIPAGADSVVPIEDVEVNKKIISLKKGAIPKQGDNIRYKGDDIKINQIAVSKRTYIKPNIISIIAACGRTKIKVYEPLKIGFLATGDELIYYSLVPVNEQIRATNGLTLATLIKDINMLPVDFGVTIDDKTEIKNKLLSAFDTDIDVLITSGGVSVGKFDYLKDVLVELGANQVFWRVNQKPGKPLLFCTFEKSTKNILVLGLPGNPVSTFVNFSLYVKPNVNQLYGITQEAPLYCKLTEKIKKQDTKRHFVNASYYYDKQSKTYFVKKTPMASSGNIFNLSQSNCLIVFEEDKLEIPKGSVVECIRL